MGQRVIIVGTGGLGREAAAWLAALGRERDLAGFLDEDLARHGDEITGLPIIGRAERLRDDLAVEVVTGTDSPSVRAGLVRHLDGVGVRLATIVHPWVTIGARASKPA